MHFLTLGNNHIKNLLISGCVDLYLKQFNINNMIIQKYIYDGSDLSDRFAYEHFRKNVLATGNIVCYVAPMKVETEFMVDLEDKLANDFIYSDKAINFLIEIPNVSLYAGVCFQRLYNSLLASLLCSKYLTDMVCEVDGDDIYFIIEGERKKASVSIAKECNGAVLIHTGINIEAGSKAPSFAYSTKLSDESANSFMTQAIDLFYKMSTDIFIATTKLVK